MSASAPTRRALLGAGLAAPFVAAAVRAHGAYPERPVRYVCPYPPGATNDNVSRVMSRALAPRLGVPVVVENRAGAGGAVGARFVAEAKADGHTLLNASASNLTIAPAPGRGGLRPAARLGAGRIRRRGVQPGGRCAVPCRCGFAGARRVRAAPPGVPQITASTG